MNDYLAMYIEKDVAHRIDNEEIMLHCYYFKIWNIIKSNCRNFMYFSFCFFIFSYINIFKFSFVLIFV